MKRVPRYQDYDMMRAMVLDDIRREVAARVAQGHSQNQVARDIGMPSGELSKVLKGVWRGGQPYRTGTVRLKALLRTAEKLDLYYELERR